MLLVGGGSSGAFGFNENGSRSEIVKRLRGGLVHQAMNDAEPSNTATVSERLEIRAEGRANECLYAVLDSVQTSERRL